MKYKGNIKNKEFVAIILSYNRADRVYTYNSLRRHGYTGDILIIIDNHDPQQDVYFSKFPNVYMFNKDNYINNVDTLDNFKKTNIVVYARNAIFDIAKKLDIKYFIMLDDDYKKFNYYFNKNFKWGHYPIKNLDYVLRILINFLETNENILTIAMFQNGDFVGGANSYYAKKIFLKRKAMNTYICKTDRPFKFFGSLNEDVNMYVYYNNIGKLIFSTNLIGINQKITQKNKGGLTDIYRELGTYTKSFYPILINPIAVKISKLGYKYKRVHHCINWEYITPKILSEDIKYAKTI